MHRGVPTSLVRGLVRIIADGGQGYEGGGGVVTRSAIGQGIHLLGSAGGHGFLFVVILVAPASIQHHLQLRVTDDGGLAVRGVTRVDAVQPDRWGLVRGSFRVITDLDSPPVVFVGRHRCRLVHPTGSVVAVQNRRSLEALLSERPLELSPPLLLSLQLPQTGPFPILPPSPRHSVCSEFGSSAFVSRILALSLDLSGLAPRNCQCEETDISQSCKKNSGDSMSEDSQSSNLENAKTGRMKFLTNQMCQGFIQRQGKVLEREQWLTTREVPGGKQASTTRRPPFAS